MKSIMHDGRQRPKKKNCTYIVLGMSILFVLLLFTTGAAASEYSKINIDLVNYQPDPARSGNILEVRLSVQNIGGLSVDNLSVEFVPKYPFTALSNEASIQNIGVIRGYQGSMISQDVKIIKFTIRVEQDVPQGIYNLKFLVRESSQTAYQVSFPVDVSSHGIAEIIHIDKNSLIPGELNELRFTINNLGTTPIRNTMFSWVNEENAILPVNSDNTKYIQMIDIGESAEIVYSVMADSEAIPGLYKLLLTLEFDDSLNGTQELNTFSGIYIGGETDFHVSLNERTTEQVIFTVANIGSNQARSVLVHIPEQQGWTTSGPSSRIIGNLNPGDYTIASFNIKEQHNPNKEISENEEVLAKENLEKNSEKSSTEKTPSNTLVKNKDIVSIAIEYTDTKGIRQTIEKKVSIGTTQQVTFSRNPSSGNTHSMQQQTFFSKYMWYIILAVFMVIFYLRHDYKRKKKADKTMNLKKYVKIG